MKISISPELDTNIVLSTFLYQIKNNLRYLGLKYGVK